MKISVQKVFGRERYTGKYFAAQSFSESQIDADPTNYVTSLHFLINKIGLECRPLQVCYEDKIQAVS